MDGDRFSCAGSRYISRGQPLTGCFIGAVSEWLKEAVLKTVVPQGTGGSNPPCSGLKRYVFLVKEFCEAKLQTLKVNGGFETEPPPTTPNQSPRNIEWGFGKM